MKRIQKELEFEVPEWANFSAIDENGIFVFLNQNHFCLMKLSVKVSLKQKITSSLSKRMFDN